MKNYRFYLPLVILFFVLTSCSEKKTDADDTPAQGKSEAIDYTEALEGAWTTKDRNREGQELIVTTIVMDGYIAESFYNVERKEFDHTFGGSWTIDGTTFTANGVFYATLFGLAAGLIIGFITEHYTGTGRMQRILSKPGGRSGEDGLNGPEGMNDFRYCSGA